MVDAARAIELLREDDTGPVEWDWDPRRDRYDVSLGPNKSTIHITGQLMAMAQTNEGAFITAFKQEMEAAMNEHKSSINTQCFGIQSEPRFWDPRANVKQAKKTLKQAKATAERERKAKKAAERYAAQQASDYELGLETLREICEDSRKYSADARVEAAKELLARTGL